MCIVCARDELLGLGLPAQPASVGHTPNCYQYISLSLALCVSFLLYECVFFSSSLRLFRRGTGIFTVVVQFVVLVYMAMVWRP